MSSITLDEARSVLKKSFGFEAFRPMQGKIIQAVYQQQDALVLMPTGGGKSICFQIPAITLPGTCVVISPLISLMKDQVEALQANGIRAAFLNSSLPGGDQQATENLFCQGELDLLYVSPEKLLSPSFLSMLGRVRLNLFAIDEAHCISSWGHDFRPEYTRLITLRKKFPDIPLIALTATADKVTRRDIIRQLGLREPAVFIDSFDRPNLYLEVRPGQQRKQQIIRFLEKHPDQSGIIYCLSRKSTERIAESLTDKGFRAEAYHAGLSDRDRSAVQERFTMDETPIICATIAFGMGIDKSNVRWVIHYNLPKNLESYYQQIGRAGRDGVRADTMLFYSYGDVAVLKDIFGDNEGDREEVKLAKLQRMQEFAESLNCRRRTLLAYFGQEYSGQCGHCDICRHPPQYFDGTRQAQMALSAVYRLREKEATRMVINVLRGSGARDLLDKGYQHIKTYGVGRKIPFSEWQYYVRQLLNMGYLELAYDEGLALKLTPASQRVLFEGEKVDLVRLETQKQRDESEREKIKKRPARQRVRDELFTHLRELRTRLAREQGIPPYVVFSDATLEQMAAEKPLNPEQMRAISGVGEKKLASYGEIFLDTIRNYLNQNTRSVKGSTYLLTLEAYHNGLDIEAIARERSLQPGTVIQHLQRLQKEGEDIDFSRLVEADKVDRVRNLIRYMEEPGLKSIFEGLDEALSYDEIRLALAVIDQETA